MYLSYTGQPVPGNGITCESISKYERTSNEVDDLYQVGNSLRVCHSIYMKSSTGKELYTDTCLTCGMFTTATLAI